MRAGRMGDGTRETIWKTWKITKEPISLLTSNKILPAHFMMNLIRKGRSGKKEA